MGRSENTQPPECHRAYVGLGTNLGERAANLQAAMERLRALGEVRRVSSLYETDPVGYRDQPSFLNMVAALRTALSPQHLLIACKVIERELGRVSTFRYGPRLIDLDILLYDELILDTPELTIPHPRLRERAFVLIPLAEIAPDIVEPRGRLSIGVLASEIDRSGVLRLP